MRYKKGTTDKRTEELAKQAKELYRSGLIAKEIAERMGKGVATIWRYFKVTGGITNQDKATHMMNRFLK